MDSVDRADSVETDRLLLRRWRPDDIDALAALFSEPAVSWYPFRRGLTREESERYLERHIDHWETHGFGMWAVELIGGKELIGYMGLAVPVWLPEVLPAVEVGWRLHPAHWGRGLATEGGRACLRHGFEVLDLDRIISIFDPDNVASGRVMAKLGMVDWLTTKDPDRGTALEIREMTLDGWRAGDRPVARRSPSPGWLFDEVSSAGRENLDVDHVARYDDKQDAAAAAEVALLVELGLDDRSQVVDLGAGTGQFTLAVAPSCARVVAVDISPVMLERLRANVSASAVSNVEVVRAGLVTYEHRGPAADFVYSRWALHHLPDFWKGLALHRMRTILRPGGVLRLSDVVYSFDPPDAEERIEQWCATVPAEAAGDGEWVRADLEEHVRDEHSTFTWLLEPMIERSGFRIDDATYSADGMLAEYVARAV